MKKIFSLLLTISICHILYGQGNVGIGTITPAYKLQVKTGDGYGISHTNGTIDVATYVDNNFGGFIGTKSNHPFQLYANDGINQFILTPAGNVGIGTLPQHRLDVHYGSARSGIHPYNRPFYVSGNIEEGSGIEFRHSNATQGIGFSYNTIYATGNNVDQMLQFASRGYAPLKFKTNGFERMTISPDGNVGIGTNPTAQLQLSNSVQNRKFILYDEADNNNQFFGFGISWGMLRYHVNGPLSDHVFFAGSSDSTANELMRIKGNGNVGIGTTAPLNRFDLHKDTIARSGDHSIDQTLYVTGDFAGGKGVKFRQTNGTEGIRFGSNVIYADGSNASQDMSMAAKGPNGNVRFGTNGWERLKIAGDGMIGISNSNPHAPLHFTNDVRNRKLVLYEIENNDHQFFGFGVNADGTLRYQTATPAFDHVFYAGSSDTTSNEVFRIKGSGQIGMGVASPMNKLDISYGPTRTGIHPTGLSAYITGDLTNNQNVEIRNYDGTHGVGFGYGSIYAAGSDSNQNLSMIAQGDTGHLSFITNTAERMTITGEGRVGIGTMNPNYKLDVRTGNNEYGFAHTNGNVQIASWIGPGGQIGTVSNHSFSLFAGDGFNQFTLLPNGNIGIGTTTPNAPLQFANVPGNRKVVLFDNFNNDHQFFGFGVDVNGHLGYHTQGFGTDHIFYSGNTANLSNELMRVKGTGNVGILTSNPNEILEIAGSGRAFFGDGGGVNRKGLLIDGVETNGARIEAYEYGAGIGLDLLLNSLGGHVGIGITNSNAPLQFSNTPENRKVVLYDNANNDNQFIGLGHNTTSLRYQVNATSSNHIFYAGTSTSASTELMRIEGTGEVGIGIAAPANKLDVHNGTARTNLNSHNTGQALYVTGGGEFRSADATTGLGIGSNNIFATGSNANVDLSIAAKGGSGNIIYNTNGTERMRITSSGNVGIGITNSPYKLDVRTGSSQFGLAHTDGTKQLATFLGDAGEIGTVSNHTFRLFANNGIKQFEMLPNGKIGIGLLGPLNRFDINNGAADRTGTHATGQALYVTGDFGSASNGVQFRNNDATQGIGFGYNTIYAAGTLASQDLNFTAKGASGNITFNTNGAEKMRITGTGNVGLGITNPNAPLQFSNNVTTRKVVLYEYANNTSQFSGFGIDGDGSMRYEIPTEGAEHVFYSGAGVDGFVELMRLGSMHGLTIERGTTIDGYLTAVGNVTVGGTMTVNGSMTVGGTIATEPFVEPTLLNSFTNWGAGYATAAYYKDKVGVVHLRGVVNRAANHNGIVVFTLPVGYRPSTSGKLLFTTQAASGLSRIDILTNGDVVVTTGSTGWISLDGITFRAD